MVVVRSKGIKNIEWSSEDSLLYYSKTPGVYYKRLSNKKETPLFFNDRLFYTNDLLISNHQLICATNKKGLLFFKDSTFIAQLDKRKGLNTNEVKQIVSNDTTLFILTAKGVQLYNLKRQKLYPANNRLNFEGVKRIALSDDKL
jgi:hypothetical protein